VSQIYLTDVGAFSESGIFYGTFDQSGNVNQWNDLDGTAGSFRGRRGGHWAETDPFDLSSSDPRLYDPSRERERLGIRLASPVAVPEPPTYALLLMTGAGALWSARRRR